MPTSNENIRLLLQARDQASQAIGRVNTRVNQLGAAAKAARGPLLLLSAAFGAATLQFARAGDQVQKLAIRTGFSTEALSELRFAAQQSGTSLEGLEKSVRRMASFLADAELGLSTSLDSLELLGVGLSDFQGKSPEETFFSFANAVADVEDPLLKAALAQDIFGRSGTALIPLFELGSEGIAKLRKEAHELGIVFSQEAADKAARLTDALNTSKQAVAGIAFEIGNVLAPTLSLISEGFAKLPSAFQKATVAAGIFFLAAKLGLISFKAALISTGIGALVVGLGVAFSLLADKLGLFTDASSEASIQAKAFGEAVLSVDEFAHITADGVDVLSVRVEALGMFVEVSGATVKRWQELLRSGVPPVQAMERALIENQIALDAQSASAENAGEAVDDLTTAAADAEESLRSLGSGALAAEIALRIFQLRQIEVTKDVYAANAAFVESANIQREILNLNKLIAQEGQIKNIIDDLFDPLPRRAKDGLGEFFGGGGRTTPIVPRFLRSGGGGGGAGGGPSAAEKLKNEVDDLKEALDALPLTDTERKERALEAGFEDLAKVFQDRIDKELDNFATVLKSLPLSDAEKEVLALNAGLIDLAKTFKDKVAKAIDEANQKFRGFHSTVRGLAQEAVTEGAGSFSNGRFNPREVGNNDARFYALTPGQLENFYRGPEGNVRSALTGEKLGDIYARLGIDVGGSNRLNAAGNVIIQRHSDEVLPDDPRTYTDELTGVTIQVAIDGVTVAESVAATVVAAGEGIA